MADCYIIDAVRTPRGIGKAGKGALSHFHSGRLLAKVFELLDDMIHSWGEVVSGHTLKHLAAGVAVWLIARMVRDRRLI